MHEMGLIIENELMRQTAGPRQGHVAIGRLGFRDIEHRAENFVHGHEGSGHTTGAAQKTASVQALLRSVFVGQFCQPALYLLLLRRLR